MQYDRAIECTHEPAWQTHLSMKKPNKGISTEPEHTHQPSPAIIKLRAVCRSHHRHIRNRWPPYMPIWICCVCQ